MARPVPAGLDHLATDGGMWEALVDVFDKTGDILLMTSRTDRNLVAQRMKVISGSIDTNEVAEVEGTGKLDLLLDEYTLNDSIVPTTPTAPLSPVSGSIIKVSIGDPITGYSIPYGVYETTKVDMEETSGGVEFSMEIADGSRKARRAKAWRPEEIPNLTPLREVVIALVGNWLPTRESEIYVTSTNHKSGLITLDVQDDRLEIMNELIRGVGMRANFNGNGKGDLIVAPTSSLEDPPIFHFVDGGNAKITSAKRGLSDETVFNGVIVMGESAGSDKPPVRAEAWDLDPASPTYFDPLRPTDSTYGPVPHFVTNQLITTEAQAQDAANALLPKVVGLSEVVTFECIPHFGMEIGDPIRLERPKLGLAGTFVVEAIRTPLTAAGGWMGVTCRERRLTIVGPQGPPL